ncbi:MAG: hypothetical protein OSB21_07815 [Myxococcota bacterium]|nr:hypothetical protein [Myxococcota bacterium]
MRILSFALALSLASSSFAAQIVAMDVVGVGAVKKSLVHALTPVLHSELSRVQGVSLVTQEDVRAMALLDATKQAMGCDETGCMADIAGALGAELLLTAQLGRVGRSYNLTLTLIQVEGVKVLRRVTGKASGSEEAASEAVTAAVGQLFSGELPEAAKGPGSLSRRAYKAALAGLRSVTLDNSLDGRPSRKRVVLDLVRTELDFDAAPKLEALHWEIVRGAVAFSNLVSSAQNKAEVDHLVACIATYSEIGRDLERVKEIRARARARGQVPSARPLRFERADAPERRQDSVAKAYLKAYADGKKTMQRALTAWRTKSRLPFAELWLTPRQSNALSTFDRERSPEADSGIVWDLLPLHAMTPQEFDRLVNSWSKDQRLIIMRRGMKGKAFHGTDRVRLKQDNGRWRIDNW